MPTYPTSSLLIAVIPTTCMVLVITGRGRGDQNGTSVLFVREHVDLVRYILLWIHLKLGTVSKSYFSEKDISLPGCIRYSFMTLIC